MIGNYYFIGSDPGRTGAIGLLDIDGNCVSLVPMPIKKIERKGRRASKKNPKGKGKSYRTVFDHEGIRDWAAEHITEHDVVFAGVENIGINPDFSHIANAAMAASKYLLIGSFCCLGFEVILMHAKTWQKEIFGPGHEADKALSIAAALRMFPSRASQLQLKKSDGLAEALLIASAIRRKVLSERNIA